MPAPLACVQHRSCWQAPRPCREGAPALACARRRKITVRRGDNIGAFLKAVREQLAPNFRELRAVSSDNLMYIKVCAACGTSTACAGRLAAVAPTLRLPPRQGSAPPTDPTNCQAGCSPGASAAAPASPTPYPCPGPQEDLIMPNHYTFHELIVNKARGKSGPLFDFGVTEDLRLLNDATGAAARHAVLSRMSGTACGWAGTNRLVAGRQGRGQPGMHRACIVDGRSCAARAPPGLQLRRWTRTRARWWSATGTSATSTSSRPTDGRPMTPRRCGAPVRLEGWVPCISTRGGQALLISQPGAFIGANPSVTAGLRQHLHHLGLNRMGRCGAPRLRLAVGGGMDQEETGALGPRGGP